MVLVRRRHARIVGSGWSTPETFDEFHFCGISPYLVGCRIPLAGTSTLSGEGGVSLLPLEHHVGAAEWYIERTWDMGPVCGNEKWRKCIGCCSRDRFVPAGRHCVGAVCFARIHYFAPGSGDCMRADCSGASLDRIRRMNRSAREAYLCSYCSARMEE